jgi:ubiquinone/menaquinone biosynthesis C-methylase UbiE
MPALEKMRCRQEPISKQFDSIVQRYLRPGDLVLDAGCGITTYAHARGKCRMVVGVDADPRINRNKNVDAIIHGDIYRLPFPDNTFDVVTSWMVLEHINDPDACFREFSRVCKPGGLMVHTTPNMLHYANFIIKSTTFKFHQWFIHSVIGANDIPYPTSYKINTPRRLKNIMHRSGFQPLEIRLIDMGPVYLSWLSPAYAVGLVYHRLVNSFKFLSSFRSFMIGVSVRQPVDRMDNSHG